MYKYYFSIIRDLFFARRLIFPFQGIRYDRKIHFSPTHVFGSDPLTSPTTNTSHNNNSYPSNQHQPYGGQYFGVHDASTAGAFGGPSHGGGAGSPRAYGGGSPTGPVGSPLSEDGAEDGSSVCSADSAELGRTSFITEINDNLMQKNCFS